MINKAQLIYYRRQVGKFQLSADANEEISRMYWQGRMIGWTMLFSVKNLHSYCHQNLPKSLQNKRYNTHWQMPLYDLLAEWCTPHENVYSLQQCHSTCRLSAYHSSHLTNKQPTNRQTVRRPTNRPSNQPTALTKLIKSQYRPRLTQFQNHSIFKK